MTLSEAEQSWQRTSADMLKAFAPTVLKPATHLVPMRNSCLCHEQQLKKRVPRIPIAQIPAIACRTGTSGMQQRICLCQVMIES